jgi:hypothetical protein
MFNSACHRVRVENIRHLIGWVNRVYCIRRIQKNQETRSKKTAVLLTVAHNKQMVANPLTAAVLLSIGRSLRLAIWFMD